MQRRTTNGGTLEMHAEYDYDVFGNRIEKRVSNNGDTDFEDMGDVVERYIYDGWKPGGGFVGNENWDVWADFDGSNTLQTRYFRGDNVDELYGRIESGSAYWTLGDHLGSVRDVIDHSGVVKDTITFDGFGNITSETDSSYGGRYKWTGREIDVETWLQYNRARYYDSTTGRWISQDPLGFEAGDSNLYRYVRNLPVTATDPSGYKLSVTTEFEFKPVNGKQAEVLLVEQYLNTLFLVGGKNKKQLIFKARRNNQSVIDVTLPGGIQKAQLSKAGQIIFDLIKSKNDWIIRPDVGRYKIFGIKSIPGLSTKPHDKAVIKALRAATAKERMNFQTALDKMNFGKKLNNAELDHIDNVFPGFRKANG